MRTDIFETIFMENKEKGKNNYSKIAKQYDNILEKFLTQKGIEHRFIRPRTPEHNGKVERSHRIDQEKFYRYLRFYSLADLKAQGRKWMTKYNNKSRFVLRFK